MRYSVETIDNFEREARRLKKKYKSLNDEISQLIDDLEENPFLGVALRDGFFKIRLGIRSKGKGSEVAITCVRVVSGKVYLLSIYDKSEQTDISNEKLNQLLAELS